VYINGFSQQQQICLFQDIQGQASNVDDFKPSTWEVHYRRSRMCL